MNWPYMQPMYYPMGMQMQQGTPADRDVAIKILKRQIKELKGDKEKKVEKKDEKKIWWKRFEVGALLFFFGPAIATAWIGVLELCLALTKNLILAH